MATVKHQYKINTINLQHNKIDNNNNNNNKDDDDDNYLGIPGHDVIS
jgi:hypothetical protein